MTIAMAITMTTMIMKMQKIVTRTIRKPVIRRTTTILIATTMTMETIKIIATQKTHY